MRLLTRYHNSSAIQSVYPYASLSYIWLQSDVYNIDCLRVLMGEVIRPITRVKPHLSKKYLGYLYFKNCDHIVWYSPWLTKRTKTNGLEKLSNLGWNRWSCPVCPIDVSIEINNIGFTAIIHCHHTLVEVGLEMEMNTECKNYYSSILFTLNNAVNTMQQKSFIISFVSTLLLRQIKD